MWAIFFPRFHFEMCFNGGRKCLESLIRNVSDFLMGCPPVLFKVTGKPLAGSLVRPVVGRGGTELFFFFFLLKVHLLFWANRKKGGRGGSASGIFMRAVKTLLCDYWDFCYIVVQFSSPP